MNFLFRFFFTFLKWKQQKPWIFLYAKTVTRCGYYYTFWRCFCKFEAIVPTFLYQTQLICDLHFIIFLEIICCVKDYIFLICYVLCLVLYNCNHIFFIISLCLFIMLMYICTELVFRVDPKMSTRVIVALNFSLKGKIRYSLTDQILLLFVEI